jgi:murein DD-endopeptidase MepM/ murein hydrolase activator NlpD
LQSVRTKPIYLLTFVLLSLAILSPTVVGAIESIKVKQGGIVSLSIRPEAGAQAIRGGFAGKTIPFFQSDDGDYSMLLGIDMLHKVEHRPFIVSWQENGENRSKRYEIEIVETAFGIQHLTLPKGKVDLAPATLVRVKKEKERMLAAFKDSLQEKLWQGSFIAPVSGRRQGTFGRKRILNGQPRRPHTGEDISASEGTEIVATNGGRVVLVGDYFFNGQSIVIDHGFGLFSMYFHLSEISVTEGTHLKRADVIGKVGQTGRVTGPHLHWGMRLNGARIDPFSLVEKTLD